MTSELSRAWPDRFATAGGPIDLANKELARIHHLALKIAGAIDARAITTVIQKRDELLIAREVFIQRGESDPNKLKAMIGNVMTVRVTRIDLQTMLAEQRRGKRMDGWELSVRDLERIIS